MSSEPGKSPCESFRASVNEYVLSVSAINLGKTGFFEQKIIAYRCFGKKGFDGLEGSRKGNLGLRQEKLLTLFYRSINIMP